VRGECEVVITGRKSVEGAIGGGMLGREKRQCLRMALKTRYCQVVSLLDHIWKWRISTYVPCERHIFQIRKYDQCCYYPRVTSWACEDVGSEFPEADSGCAGTDYDRSRKGYGFER